MNMKWISAGAMLALAFAGFGGASAFAASGDIILTGGSQTASEVTTGQANTYTVELTNTGPARTVLVDLEVAKVGAGKVGQAFTDAVAFAEGESRTFQITTSDHLDPGAYYFSIGIFNPGWNGLLWWYHRQEEFTARSPEMESQGVMVSASWETAASVSQGQTTTFSAQFHNYAADDRTVLTDIELHDINGAKISQAFLDDVHFSSGEERVGNLISPDNLAPGTYYYSVGIFNPGWNGLLHWFDHLKEFTVH